MEEVIHRISVFIVWVPFIWISNIGSKLDNSIILFRWFLFASGLIDLIGFLIPLTEEGDWIYYPIHLIYLFIEGILILLICFKFIAWKEPIKSEVKRFGLYFLVICTLIIFITLILMNDLELFIDLSSIFSATLLIVFSFVSAFALLGLAESNIELLSYPWFWILSGILIYSMGSFFIDLLIPADIAHHVYFMRHVINILRSCFFIVGVWCFSIRVLS